MAQTFEPDYAAEFQAAMAPYREAAATDSARTRASIQELFQQALLQVPNQNPVAPMAVPQTPDPLQMALAGGFANVNAFQTGSGQAPAMVSNEFFRQLGNRQSAIETNQDSERRFQEGRLNQAEGIHRTFLNAQLEQAINQNNLEGAFQHSKALYMLEGKKKAREDKAAAELEQKRAARDQQYAMARIAAGKKDSPEDKAAKAEAEEDKKILRFQEDISNVSKKPGMVVEGREGGFTLPLIGNVGGSDVKKLSDAGLKAVRTRSAQIARSAGGERLRKVGLEQYLDTLPRDDNGKVIQGSPEYAELNRLMKAVFPDAEKQKEWAASVGLI